MKTQEPIYPVLGLLPIGIFGTAVLFDLAALISGLDYFATVGFWNLAGGVLAGLLVAGLCATELKDRRAGVQGLLHAGMLGLFAMVWLSRWDRYTLGLGAYLLELLALAAGIAGTWLIRDRVTGAAEPVEEPPANRWLTRDRVVGVVRSGWLNRATPAQEEESPRRRLISRP